MATSRTPLPTPDQGCRPIAVAGSLDRTAAAQLAQLFKAVADPARLQILSVIRSAPDHEVCVCELTGPLGLSQPTVSHHLKILTEAGVLVREQRGTWAWFSLAPEGLVGMAAFLADTRATA